MAQIMTVNWEMSRGLYELMNSEFGVAELEQLGLEIDALYFGESSILANDIKNQGSEPAGGHWKPLSKRYLEWKRKKIMNGEDIKGEGIPPKKVISEQIGVRTGKMREFCQTQRDGRLKRLVINPQNFLTGKGAFIEWYAKGFNSKSKPDGDVSGEEYPGCPGFQYILKFNMGRPLFEQDKRKTAKDMLDKILKNFAAGIVKKYALARRKGGTFKIGAELI